MTVDFVGARREMEIPVPYLDKVQSGNASAGSYTQWQLQKRKIRTIIPDAYQVSITIKELFGETQNFMYQMLRESMDDKITVSSKSSVQDRIDVIKSKQEIIPGAREKFKNPIPGRRNPRG